MGKYRITAARPKNEVNHLKSEFRIYHRQQNPDKTWSWTNIGWKSVHYVSDLLEAGHEVRTGKIVSSGEAATIEHGAAVELELRIAHNDVDFRISQMPDK